MQTAPVVTTDPVDQAVPEGGTAQFSAAATGVPAPSVQWQVSSDGESYDDIEGAVARLREEGGHFRNDIVTGVGGKQVLVEDPSGNPVELFEPTLPEARLADD